MYTDSNGSSRERRRSFRAPRITTLTLLAYSLYAFLSSPSPTSAQTGPPFFPVPIRSPATARTPTRFYIISGDSVGVEPNLVPIPQFMSLDLSVSWPSNQPIWHQLLGGPRQYIFPAAISADGQTLIAFRLGPSFAMRYSIATNSWSSSQIKPDYASMQGIGAVTDPDTGLVYLAAGFTGNRDTMSVYDFKSDTMTTAFRLPAPEAMFRSRAYYANVWCKHTKSILYFGGYNTTLDRIASDNILTEFVPSTNTLSTVATTGPAPPMRADHCMASNDDGTLIVIYGGRIQGQMFANDIYVYNAVTRTWQAGPPGLFRVYAACTISGNQLLVWGGQDEKQRMVDSNVLIFNINTMAWIDHYAAPSSLAALPQPSSSTGDSPSDSSNSGTKSNVGLVVGASIGGLAFLIVASLMGYFILRQKKHPQGASLLCTRGDDDDPDRKRGRAYPDETTRNDEELQHLRVQLQTQQEELELHRRLLQLQQEQQQIQQEQQQIQQQQQQASQYLPHTQPYQVASIYTGPAVGQDPFRNVSGAYPQDTKTTPYAGSSTMSSAADYSPQQQQHHHHQQQSPIISPNSLPIYAAHPYQPHILVPSPTPSHSFVTTSAVAGSAANSTAPSRVNSFSVPSYNYGEGSSGNGSSSLPRGYKSEGPSNPQFGARER
ncbi:hypothetical protein BGZ96_012345 [Linnemannia gamsii]|uniref:Galactose oxidase n=1 Tax=Linnemannia gamsii TaxID=64522 RepID=A0ABQ7JRI3_9FUNG|nr:hypothetical protein BGZ96_012345 [Linnemannia gamsii]